jgi:deazaflavin-dependent oxidoreductase (nitroreductase family)
MIMMTNPVHLTMLQRIFRTGNNFLLTTLVPLDKPGRALKWLFRFPLLHSALGLNFLIPNWMLLLTTTGRNTGKPHTTPVEYLYRPQENHYWIMSGWRGNTDWSRNLLNNPNVSVQIDKRKFLAVGSQLGEDKVVEYLQEILRINPAAIAIFSRWCGKDVVPTIAGLREASINFPTFKLEPINNSQIRINEIVNHT